MRQRRKLLSHFLVFLILVSGTAGAQISGVVTLNGSIPSSASNFTSFAALAAVLNGSGVNGPLIVNVTTGTYVEQINFTQAAGVSPINTITINGNNSTLTFNSTSTVNRHTLLLSGADYMTFTNLTISGTGASNALTCHLWQGADNNAFVNCVFNAPTAGSSANLCPFSISGASSAAVATGVSGNNNSVNTCTMNGGYYGVVFYGNTTSPFNQNNQVVNSKIWDFYANGIYNGYCVNSIIKGNSIERPTRTAITSTEAIYLNTGTLNALLEGNHVRRLFNSGTTVYAYGIYSSAVAGTGTENVIRNNIISDIRSNGVVYGMYVNAAPYTLVYHNTISLDDVTATAGVARGIHLAGTSTNCKVNNNLITITRGGSGAKHCLYYAATSTLGLSSDNNVLYLNAPAGINSIGWQTNDYITLSNWQSATGYDLASKNVDPAYVNPGVLNYEPTSVAANNLGVPTGVTTDFFGSPRSDLFPDPGAIEIYTTNCAGAPGSNSLVTPAGLFCQGINVNLNLQNSSTYTNVGYTIAWQTSTNSATGPFTTVPGATLNSYSSPTLNTTTFFRAIITCTNGGGTFVTFAQGVNVMPYTNSVVPCSEGFESLVYNKLPNCSWSASNMGGTTLTHTSQVNSLALAHNGSNFASFYNTPAGTSYFYTNAIQLNSGVTYSAALWYITETLGFNKWTDLSIFLVTGQSPTGSLTIVSTNGPVNPQLYTPLSNTFSVLSSGPYYIGIKGTSATGVSPYLVFDDLSVTIPCQFNAPNVSLISSTTTICEGQSINLTAIGNATYSWSTGQTASLITVAPTYPTTYSLIATNPLSNCSSTLSQYINVLNTPQVVALASSTLICPGKTTNLTAFGADLYYWVNNSSTQSIPVSPFVTTTYSVTGTNSLGCSDSATVKVVVHPAPSVSVVVTQTLFCKGEETTLIADGAVSFQWQLKPGTIELGNFITVSLTASGVFTVTGTDQNGCEAMQTVTFEVDECTGITGESKAAGSVVVGPNPTSGRFFVIPNGGNVNTISVLDATGKLVYELTTEEKRVNLNLSDLSAGIYCVKIQSGNSVQHVKLIKE